MQFLSSMLFHSLLIIEFPADESGEVMITFNNPRKGDVDITLIISGASSLHITPTSGNPAETNPEAEEVRFQNII